MNKNIIIIILGLLLTNAFTYSFLQYYNTPLDGDMAGGIVPSKDVQEIFNDPFGFSSILTNKKHPNPNRFFAHLFFKDYFQKVPLLFQKVVTPINSIYYSSALIKLIIKIMIIYLLSAMISKSKSIFNLKLLIVAILITPLFQAYGYNGYMGIIDKSITYTFFYALPLMLLLLFFYPFYTIVFDNKSNELNRTSKIFMTLLVIILPFSGPLIPAIILIVTTLLFLFYFIKNIGIKHLFIKTLSDIPKDILVFFIPISLLSIYSLLLGTYNSTYQTDVIPVAERYWRLPLGIYYQFTQKLGFPILFIMIASNIFLIKKYFNNKDSQKIINSLKWIGVFSILYILLLPLGGYRPYRPNILRYDTIMPITICLIYIYGISSYFLIMNLNKRKLLYYTAIITFSLIFFNADKSNLNENKCEKQALISISNSNKKIVPIKNNCKVLSWEPITDYNQSRLNARLLKMWNITNEIKFYYNEPAANKSNRCTNL